MDVGLDPELTKWSMRPVSQTSNIVTKINILLQEIRDIKLQNKRNNIFNVHKTHPKDTDVRSGQDDKHLIYNNASTHLPLDKMNTPGHHAPNPTHIPHTDDNVSGPLYPNTPSVLFCTFPRPASPTSSTYLVGCPNPM